VDLRVGVEGKRAVRRWSTRGKSGASELVMGCASKRKEMVVGEGKRAREGEARRDADKGAHGHAHGRNTSVAREERAGTKASGRERRELGVVARRRRGGAHVGGTHGPRTRTKVGGNKKRCGSRGHAGARASGKTLEVGTDKQR